MSWITAVWAANVGACLVLGGVHLLVWFKSRRSWANLAFAVAAAAGAMMAMLEVALMRSQTPAQYGDLLRWLHVAAGLAMIATVWFVWFYLKGGRLWLAWLVCAIRVLTGVLTFTLDPNLNFHVISDLQTISVLGEPVAVPVGVKNPLTNITHLSVVFFFIFTVEAASTAWRNGERRRAAVVGFSVGAALLFVLVTSELMNLSKLSMPMMVSFGFMFIVAGFAVELSTDLARTHQLASDLEVNQSRMSLAARVASVTLWDWDVARDEVWVNTAPRERDRIGAKERLTLDRMIEGLDREYRDTFRQQIREAMTGSGAFQAEYCVTSGTGEQRWYSAKGKVERDAKGDPIHVRGVSLDITDRHVSEAVLQRREAELAHVQRVSTIGQLASTLAHELNQPLGAILRNAEAGELLLQQHPPDHEEVQAILADIKCDERRATAVIDRMRTLMRRSEPSYQSVPPIDLAQQVVPLVRSAAQRHKVTPRVEILDDLPPILGDPVQLQQVLLNLILNAMDAMDGTPAEQRRLTLSARPGDGSHVVMMVSDTGRGMSAEELAHAFQPFYTTKSNGLGMGLSLSRTIVEAHGGAIWATESPEGGMTFCFRLKTAPTEGDA